LPLIFAFIFVVPCLLVSFDALPISSLFFPTITARNSSKGLENGQPLSSSQSYRDLDLISSQEVIRKELTGSSGVYCFTHLASGRSYVGSSVDL
jgi:hypothetical protein